MIKRFWLVWITVLAMAGYAQGQPAFSAGKVTAEVVLESAVVAPGGRLDGTVLLRIEEGWHVNANPAALEWLIPTELRLTPPEGITLEGVAYPPSKTYRFSFAQDKDLTVYEGDAPIRFILKAGPDLEPGVYAVSGVVRVQACDDMTCLPPSNLEISFLLTVDPAAVTDQEPVATLPEGFVPFSEAGNQQPPNAIAQLVDESGWAWTFLTIFLIGLALNLTPCVYPMLTVTVSIFGGQQDSSTWRVFGKAVVYVLGIATMYSVLGVLAALSGGLFGSFLQSSWVLLGIGLLLFALALSSFGLYEITLPYWLTKRLGGTGQVTGLIGVYVSGLVVGVFAAPCIGPPVVALLAFVGAKGDAWFGFWSFFVLSLGLGLPYLILGTFSGLLNRLPRSGVWMVWVKQLFGVVLTGVAAFYVGLAFFPEWTPWVIPVTAVAGGLWLGFLQGAGWWKRAVGVLGILLGIWTGNALLKPGVEWTPYSTEAFDQALAEGRPIVLDFYADWCIPCLEMDRTTFVDERVIEALEPYTRFKVDLTNFDSPESEALRRRFDVAGVPTIVFIGPDGHERTDARAVGYVGADAFLGLMGDD